MADRRVINWNDLDDYVLQHMSKHISSSGKAEIVHMHFIHKTPSMPVIEMQLMHEDGKTVIFGNNMHEVAVTLTFLSDKMADICIDLYKAMEHGRFE